MGLNVTALSKVKFIAARGEPDDMYDQGYEHAYVNSDFADRADGRETGFYSYEQRLDFPAGSYHSYNAFRDWLSHLAFGVPAETVWNNVEEYANRPFFELIHFADNEGIIGTGPAKRIAKAFADHDEQAVADSGYYEEYVTWQRAFELAADDGFVDFH